MTSNHSASASWFHAVFNAPCLPPDHSTTSSDSHGCHEFIEVSSTRNQPFLRLQESLFLFWLQTCLHLRCVSSTLTLLWVFLMPANIRFLELNDIVSGADCLLLRNYSCSRSDYLSAFGNFIHDLELGSNGKMWRQQAGYSYAALDDHSIVTTMILLGQINIRPNTNIQIKVKLPFVLQKNIYLFKEYKLISIYLFVWWIQAFAFDSYFKPYGSIK